MTQIRSHTARLLDRTPPGFAHLMRTDHRIAKFLRPVLNQLLPDRETTVTVRAGVGQGLRLPILPRAEKYYWTGLHEPHVQQALMRELQPGSVVWDVGAHIGFTSLIAARLVGPAGRVEAFEPYPPNQQRLTRAITLNGAANVGVHPEALGAEPGTRVFHLHDSSLQGSLVEIPGGQSIKVPCTTLDDLAGDLPAPDLVKVDAEGAELEVLAGGRRLLASSRPRLLVEFTTSQLFAEARQLFPFYDAAHLGQNHWLLVTYPS